MNGRSGIGRWKTNVLTSNRKLECTVSRDLYNEIEKKRDGTHFKGTSEVIRYLLREWVDKK